MTDSITPMHSLLVKAREKISYQDSWCKSKHAVDSSGKIVPSHDPSAVRWCMVGCLLSSAYGLPRDTSSRIRHEAESLLTKIAFNEPRDNPGLWVFNDRSDTTHARVLAVFDEAIVHAEYAGI